MSVQRSAKFLFPGCVYFCLALPGSCLAKHKNLLAALCTVLSYKEITRLHELAHVARVSQDAESCYLITDQLKSVSVLLSITQAEPGRNTRNLGKGI